MARCGIDLDGLCKAFPRFPMEEIEKIYLQVCQNACSGSTEQDIKDGVTEETPVAVKRIGKPLQNVQGKKVKFSFCDGEVDFW